jgi:hypothetical protein
MEKTTAEFAKLLDRAIALCDAYVPVTDRNPTPGGDNVRTTAVGFLVAARALVAAAIETETKK